MSESEGYEKQVTHADGVTVTKRFEEDEFPVPAIAFEFTSDRDEQVWVKLSDTVPDGIEVEDLGFHPEYGSEYWMIEDDTITFERDLDAGESYTTVYGIRATGTENVEQFLTEPTLEEIDPPLSEDEQVDDIIPGSDDDVVGDAILGDGEIPGLDDETDGSIDDEDIETLNLNDPNSTAETGSQAGDPVDAGDGIVAAFVAELRSGSVSPEDVKVLQQAFGGQQSRDGSADAKIEQLQTDIADLRAYTNALEEFLDEEGTGQQLIEDFEEQLASFENQLREMQSSLSEQDENIETALGEVEGITETVERVEGEVDSLTDDVDDIEGTIANMEADIDRIDEELVNGEVLDRMDELAEDLEDLQTWQEQIKETFGG